jgi:hypothetical protein
MKVTDKVIRKKLRGRISPILKTKIKKNNPLLKNKLKSVVKSLDQPIEMPYTI